MPEPTSATLAEWLRDVVATVPDADALKAFQAAVVLGAKCTGSEMLDVVALGHRAAGKEKVEWFADLARSKDAPIPTVGHEALATRLAAASTVRVITSGGDAAIIAGLATQSAAFLGLRADLPEVTSFANDAIFKAGDAVRTRALSYEPTARQVPGWVDAVRAAPSERPEWEAPAVAVAKQLDALAAEFQKRLDLLDEEYNVLWWSHAGRSLTADKLWAEVSPPARRVALVGHELATQTRIPATAMVDGLAAAALGDVATKQLTLADVVVALRDEEVPMADVEHTLLPMSTAAIQANVYNEDDTWKTVMKKVYGINVGDKRHAATIARQLIRERHLGELL
jgi:hypothetical protein